MKRVGMLFVVLFWSMGTISRAQNAYNFYTYAKWERLPAEMKMAYVGGAVDVLTGVAATVQEQKLNGHYGACLNQSGFSLMQLSTHIEAYAEGHPNVQRYTMPGVIINYLIELCGAPPQPPQ